MNKLSSLLNFIGNFMKDPTVTKTDVNETTCFAAIRSDTETGVWMGIGTGGTNHGVWSGPLGRWLCHSDGDKAFFDGGQIDSGAVTIAPSAGNTPTSIDVTFNKTFARAPKVVATAQSSVPGTVVTGVGVSNVTTTGCKIWVTRTNTSNTSIHWIATTID